MVLNNFGINFEKTINSDGTSTDTIIQYNYILILIAFNIFSTELEHLDLGIYSNRM